MKHLDSLNFKEHSLVKANNTYINKISLTLSKFILTNSYKRDSEYNYFVCVQYFICWVYIYIYIYIKLKCIWPFYRTAPKSELETSWKKCVFSQEICMYANCVISKVHINCAVFSESFGIFVLSPNLSLYQNSNNNFIRRVILTY